MKTIYKKKTERGYLYKKKMTKGQLTNLNQSESSKVRKKEFENKKVASSLSLSYEFLLNKSTSFLTSQPYEVI